MRLLGGAQVTRKPARAVIRHPLPALLGAPLPFVIPPPNAGITRRAAPRRYLRTLVSAVGYMPLLCNVNAQVAASSARNLRL
jgi:hypothetical protein